MMISSGDFDWYQSHDFRYPQYWQDFCDIPLAEFNGRVYHTLRTQEHAISDGARRMLVRMVEYDILGLYLDWENVPASAARIGQRFRRSNPLVDIGRDLAPVRNDIERAFLGFYPDLLDFSAHQASLLNQTAARPSNIATDTKSL